MVVVVAEGEEEEGVEVIEAMIACIIVGSAYDSGSFVKSCVGCESDVICISSNCGDNGGWGGEAGSEGGGGAGGRRGSREEITVGIGNDEGGGNLLPGIGSGYFRPGRGCWI
jgi:hypothetical protein